MLQTLDIQKTKTAWSNGSTILSTYAGMDSASWQLGLVNSLDNKEFQDAIAKLAKESVVPNPFFELPILKPALKNLGGSEVQFLYLSKQTGTEESLKLFAPVSLRSIGILRRKVLRTWNHIYAPLGMPLIANDTGEETLKAFIECMDNAHHEKARAIVFEQVAKEGRFIKNLYYSRHLSSKLLLAIGTPRAGLKPLENMNYEQTHFSGRRKQRLNKARTELETLGKVTFQSFRSQKSIEKPLEDFLTLEGSGWKGKRKTALNSSPENAQFCRQAVFNCARENKCTIYSLELNCQTIASLILFESNGYYYPWKIAYDERYAKYSVGNLLMVYATTDFANMKKFRGLDTLAAEHNATALRFWPDEKEFFTMIIGIGKNATQTTLSITDELNRLKRIRTTLHTFLKNKPYLESLVSSLRI